MKLRLGNVKWLVANSQNMEAHKQGLELKSSGPTIVIYGYEVF
jgi:hypothetical protein